MSGNDIGWEKNLDFDIKRSYLINQNDQAINFFDSKTLIKSRTRNFPYGFFRGNRFNPRSQTVKTIHEQISSNEIVVTDSRSRIFIINLLNGSERQLEQVHGMFKEIRLVRSPFRLNRRSEFAKFFVTAGVGDHKIVLWDTQKGATVKEFYVNSKRVQDLCFYEPESFICCSRDNVLRFFNIEKLCQMNSMYEDYEQKITGLCSIPDRGIVVTMGELPSCINFIDIREMKKTQRTIKKVRGQNLCFITSCAYYSSRNTLLVGNSYNGGVYGIDLRKSDEFWFNKKFLSNGSVTRIIDNNENVPNTFFGSSTNRLIRMIDLNTLKILKSVEERKGVYGMFLFRSVESEIEEISKRDSKERKDYIFEITEELSDFRIKMGSVSMRLYRIFL